MLRSASLFSAVGEQFFLRRHLSSSVNFIIPLLLDIYGSSFYSDYQIINEDTIIHERDLANTTLGVGIGRSHFEASSLMLGALVDGNYSRQSEMERQITMQVNEANIGPLGLHGSHSVLATFLKVGPQRASGVRIVCLRPCCCFEPRIASMEI